MTTDFTNCPFCGKSLPEQPVSAEPKRKKQVDFEEWLEMRKREARNRSPSGKGD